MHRAVWKERGLLSAQGAEIKHAAQIQGLLESIQNPPAVAIMHCKAHRTGKTPPETGNQLADKAAKEAAETGIVALLPEKEITLPETPPKYENKDANNKDLTGTGTNGRVGYNTHTGQVVILPLLVKEIARHEHNNVHWGTEI